MAYSKEKLQEIQEDYDSGMSWRKVIKKHNIAFATIQKYIKLGDLKTRTQKEGVKLHREQNPNRKHTEETKRKISIARKKYITENPDKIPYIINHVSNGMSYPEKYFKDVFEKENMELIYNYSFGTYWLDFADPINKIDIEIDGSQHEYDSVIVEHDKKRDEYVKSMGWTVVRIKWSDYNSLPYEEKNKVVIELKKLVTEGNGNVEIKKHDNSKKCIDCGVKLGDRRSIRCRKCNSIHRRK